MFGQHQFILFDVLKYNRQTVRRSITMTNAHIYSMYTLKTACNICYIDRRGSDISLSFGLNTKVIFTVEPHKSKIWMFPPQPMSIKLGLKKKAEIFKRFPMKRTAK